MSSPAEPYRLLTDADLAGLPAPTWQIESLLPKGGLSVLFGPSGCGKSFLGFDWSACVAAGIPWYGREAKPGPVVYIAAEGSAGLGVRIGAWKEARQVDELERLYFLPEAINFLDKRSMARAHATIATLPEPPALIVTDTMARSIPGADENAARDVGLFVAAIDELRGQAGALVIHHTGKAGTDERGSSALRGAADMMASLKPDGAGVVLNCEKMKDAEEFDPWRLHLETIGDSCVFRCGTDPGRIAPSELAILRAVSESFGTRPVSKTEIKDVADVPKSSFYRSVKTLVERGFLAPQASARGERYVLTRAGVAEVSDSPIESHGTPPTVPSHTPSLGGGTWDETERESA